MQSIPNTMKSLQIVAPNKVEMVDLPIPKHGDNEVLVKYDTKYLMYYLNLY